MKYQTFAEKALGESHKKTNKPCQDNTAHFSGNGVHIAVVSDGHGSDNCFRNEYGSDFAVKAAMEGIKGFISNPRQNKTPLKELSAENFARELRELSNTIVNNWISRVSNHYRASPITEEELDKYKVDGSYRKHYLKEAKGEQSEGGSFLDEAERPVTRHAYGATLVAAAVTKDFWFGIQIGDGKFTSIYPDGSYAQPIPWDDKCYLNVTTSICDDDAAERARVYVKKIKGDAAAGDVTGIKQVKCNQNLLPACIFVNSDGVDDSFPIDDNMEHMVKKFYFPVLRMFIENDTDKTKGWDASVKELAEFLPGMSKRGSGDDISVSGMIDMDAVKADVFQAALAKAKTEAEERRVREQAEREEAARKAAEAAIKAEKEAAEKAKAEKEAAEEETGYGSFVASTAKPDTPIQPADDPAVQKAAQEYLEAQAKLKEAKSRLKETVELSRQQNPEYNTEPEIPSSDAKPRIDIKV